MTTDFQWKICYFLNDGTAENPSEEQNIIMFHTSGIPPEDAMKEEIILQNKVPRGLKTSIVIITYQRIGNLIPPNNPLLSQ